MYVDIKVVFGSVVCCVRFFTFLQRRSGRIASCCSLVERVELVTYTHTHTHTHTHAHIHTHTHTHTAVYDTHTIGSIELLLDGLCPSVGGEGGE